EEKGRGAQSVAQSPVTLSARIEQRINVVYHLAGGSGVTATRNVDYTGGSAILTFEPGETSKVISIPIVGDSLDEPDETFSILLGFFNATNFTLGKDLAIGTIRDDDAPPTVAIRDVSVAEGDSDAGQLA